MKKINLKECVILYKNTGMQAEAAFVNHFTGTPKKADNISHTVKADYGDIQIKSYHATVARGTYSIDEYLKNDKAMRFAYVTKDYRTAYIMSKIEYKVLCDRYTTRDRSSVDGSPKLRLKRENRDMMKFLEYMVTEEE